MEMKLFLIFVSSLEINLVSDKMFGYFWNVFQNYVTFQHMKDMMRLRDNII